MSETMSGVSIESMMHRLKPEAAASVCAHCGLPVPAGLISQERQEQFCCHGCETAFGVIRSCGLGAYHEIAQRLEGQSAPARVSGRGYHEFDDPVFTSLYCRQAGPGLVRTELMLEGVHCAACVWLLERLPRVLPGVAEARLDLRRATLAVTFDPKVVRLSRIAQTIDAFGYPAHPARGPGVRAARRAADRVMLVRMAVAGACAGNIMLLFLALYAGMFTGIEAGYEQLFRWTAMGLNTICLAWPATVFARGAIAAIRARSITLDLPIALGLYLGGAWGIGKTIAGQGDLYFDSISALVFFLLVGRYVQQRQQRFAADSVELLFSLTPTVARRLGPDGAATEVATESLVVGDLVEVRAGECSPADGRVEQGTSRIDNSLLTGESRPIAVEVGDVVAGGALNIASALRIRVEAVGEASLIGRLMRLVGEAAGRRAPIVMLADRWGAWLLWILLSLAAITLALWWHLGAATAIDRAAALLIATCPCGLGLATPMAMTMSIGRAARRGVLIRGGESLQALAGAGQTGTLLLDKTGTITQGRLSLVCWAGDESARRLLAAVEAGSSHPVACALVRDLGPLGPADAVARGVVQHAGAGVEGSVGEHQVLAGTRAFLGRHGVKMSSQIDQLASSMLGRGLSPVFVAINGSCVAAAGLGDPVRPDAARVIAELRRQWWQVRIVSGDHPSLVAAVAAEVGLDPSLCLGGVSPEGKLAVVRSLQAHGPVVMVGDGVNDAAALAGATVGIAVRGGAEACLAAADITLRGGGIEQIGELVAGAKATMRTIRWTIAASIAYNVVAASLSIAGLISPLLAAVIMPASSLTVVMLAINSRAFRGRAEARGAQR